jgi:hypothetical protein
MVKTVITPQNNTVVIAVPNGYIGKEIEVLLFSKDELTEEVKGKTSNSVRFKGLLTTEEGERFEEYLKQVRNEWDRGI